MTTPSSNKTIAIIAILSTIIIGFFVFSIISMNEIKNATTDLSSKVDDAQISIEDMRSEQETNDSVSSSLADKISSLESKVKENQNSAQDEFDTSLLNDDESYNEDSSMKWIHEDSKDRIRQSISTHDYIVSNNIVYLTEPYDGGSYLKLDIVNSDKNGAQIALSISNGKFAQGHYVNRTIKYTHKSGKTKGKIKQEYSALVKKSVLIKFDDNAPIKVNYNNTELDNIVYLENVNSIISHLKNAKTIVIEADFDKNGSKQFVFQVNKPLYLY